MKSLVVLVLLFAPPALAFPEMVRHGYTHCTACHTTLVGGGLLNEYGRSLSRELLAQPTLGGKAPAEGDESFLGGAVQPPSWLNMGGDIRLLQTFVESKKASSGRFMIMQVDLDAAFQLGERWRAFLSIGRTEPKKSDATAKDYVTSPRHWIEYLLSSPDSAERWTLRAGRFMPAYGIAFAEHTLYTRRYLDFSPGQERTAAELAWMNDRWSVIATGIFAQSAFNQLKSEKGGALQIASAVGESSKLGLSLYQTDRDDGGLKWKRRIYGLFAHVGFSKDWYGLLEVDRPQGADGKWGVVETFKLGREVSQGVHLIALQEFANLDSAKANPKMEAFGVGAEWFPRPHWDLYGVYRKERNTAVGDEFNDVVWLILHYYL